MVSKSFKKSEQQGGEGSPESCFFACPSPSGESMASAEVGSGAQGAVCQGEEPLLVRGGFPPQLATSSRLLLQGGQWTRGQCPGPAASSLVGHIQQSAASRGRERSWWSTLKRGWSCQFQLGEEQPRKPWRRQLQVAASAQNGTLTP